MTYQHSGVLRGCVLLVCLSFVVVANGEATSQSAQERLDRGMQLLQDNQPGEALEELQKLIDDGPDLAPAYFYAGVALGRLERYEEAYDYLVHAAELDPGNGQIHQMACVAAVRGQHLEESWEQAILAAQAGVDMSSIFSQLENAGPPPEDFEARMAAPRVYVAEIDLSALVAADLQPGEEEQSASEVTRSLVDIAETRRQFGLGLLRSPSFSVVKQEEGATFVLLIQADRFGGSELDGYIKLLDPASGDEVYSRRLSLSDIGTLSALRGDIARQITHLESWLEQES